MANIFHNNAISVSSEKIIVFKNGITTSGYTIEPIINGGGTAFYDSSTKTWKCSVVGKSNPIPKAGIKISGLKENDFVFIKLKNVNLPKAQYSYFSYGSLTYTGSSFPDSAIVKDIMYIADTVDARKNFEVVIQYWADKVKANFEVEEIWIEKVTGGGN